MRVFVFKKSGFKERQSEKLKDSNKRKAILVDSNLNNDSKILLLHSQKDYTLLGAYFHILSRLELETETWVVRVDEFKNWFRRTFNVNNRFNIEERLEWLSNNGLIEFLTGSNEVLTDSLTGSNEVLKHVETPLETPETLAALRATKTNETKRNETKQKPPTPLRGESEFFKKFYSELYPRRENRPDAWKAWQQMGGDSLVDDIFAGIEKWRASGKFKNMRYVPMPGPWLRGERWKDDLIMQGAGIDDESLTEHDKEMLWLTEKALMNGN
jgi:hypothetical protein